MTSTQPLQRMAAALLVVALAVAAPRARAGATLRIDENRSITVALALRPAVSSHGAALGPDGRTSDLALEGALLALTGEFDRRLRIQLNAARAPTGEIRLSDGFLQFEPFDAFKLWAGRFLPPGDRAVLTGPFFGTSWDTPFVSSYPGLAGGRDDGVAAWGVLWRDRLKYQVGAFRGRVGGSNDTGQLSLAGRVTVDLLDPEPGYYATGTYLGSKSILALAASAHRQGNGAGTVDQKGDYLGYDLDLLAEKAFAAGVFTFEGAYYRTDLGGVLDTAIAQGAGFYVQGAWIAPGALGPGRVQLDARYQAFIPDTGYRHQRVDAGAQYLLSGQFLKLGLNLSREQTGAEAGPQLVYTAKLGAQLIL